MLLRLLEKDTGSLIIHDSDEDLAANDTLRKDTTLTSNVSVNEEVVFGVESADVSLEDDGLNCEDSYRVEDEDSYRVADEDSYRVADEDSYRVTEPDIADQHVPLNFRISDEV